MKAYFTISLFCLIAFSGFSQTPPVQPTSGPGGSDYTHTGVIFSEHTTAFNSDGYWLFEPTQPKPDTADLIVFNHGYGVFDPGPYGAWIEHLVKKGHIVIFPRYQLGDQTLPGVYTDNAVTGILNALDELANNPARVKPRLERFTMIGHSYGGVVTSNIVLEYASLGVPKPQCFMLCQPGTGGINGGRLTSYAGMDTDYKALIVIGENDAVVGDAFGREIYDSTLISTTQKNLVMHLKDNYSSPVLQATHNEPLATNNNYNGITASAVIAAAYAVAKEDAVDYFCYWKLADALMNCTHYGTDCEYAFGDTEQQKGMGEWSDGTIVLKLDILPKNHIGVAELEQELKMQIQPNPTENIITIVGQFSKMQYTVYDVAGKLIEKGIITAGNSIDVSTYNSGLYQIHVADEMNQKVLKFIKK